jgi:protein TonB
MHATLATFPAAFRTLDGQRIAGTSLAIALHAAVAMVLLMPVQQPPAPSLDEPVYNPVTFPKYIPLVPITKATKPVTDTHLATHSTPATATAPPQDNAADPSPEGILPPTIPGDGIDPQPTLPALADLQVDVGPAPTYPFTALRRGQEGRVLLRVLVDEQGRPSQVSIEQSSGVRLLDDTALKFVQARWHFVPAQRNGIAIAAYALVPIVFRIER